MKVISSFFDHSYKTPRWLQQKITRRKALKSAAGAMAITAMPIRAITSSVDSQIKQALKSEPWQTLDAVLMHLLPASATGPSAKEIQATHYLYNVVHLQPTAKDEIEFIYQGVGWLNGYTQSQVKKDFFTLANDQKETMLRAISGSQAGQNWLNNLINYLYEAMLSPPIYGGNPEGIGWQWLDHQAGFPLPKVGDRYYELPGQQAISIKFIPEKNYLSKVTLKQGRHKA
ncbi:MAG: gluconate 2-dehydrogenase gamma chain [Alteromonadaceae bacterium]|jgi:gluconate 2-dehydrogenase gamma chain